MKPDELRGHLDALILAVVENGPLHGYAIMEALQEHSDGAIEIPTGTLYPALRRLERIGYLRSSWNVASGRRRRSYQLTNSGRKALADERSAWQTFTSVIGGVLGSSPGRS